MKARENNVGAARASSGWTPCSEKISKFAMGLLDGDTTSFNRAPISITAVTGAELDQAGIEDMAGLAHAMAGVNYADKGPFGGVNGANLMAWPRPA
jgi:hypothetical protein